MKIDLYKNRDKIIKFNLKSKRTGEEFILEENDKLILIIKRYNTEIKESRLIKLVSGETEIADIPIIKESTDTTFTIFRNDTKDLSPDLYYYELILKHADLYIQLIGSDEHSINLKGVLVSYD